VVRALPGSGEEQLGAGDHLPPGGVVLATPELVEAQPVDVLGKVEIAPELEHRVLSDGMMRGKEAAEPEAHGRRRYWWPRSCPKPRTPIVGDVGPLTAAERYAFDVQGYLVRRRALNDRDIASLRRAVDNLRVPPPGAGVMSQRFKHFLHTDGVFVSLLDHPSVLPVLVELCGTGVRLDHAYGLVMDQGQSGLGLHGGGTPFDPAQFYVVNGGAISCGLVAVQWALVDQPAGSGGFCCIPGSHKASFALPAERDLAPLAREVPLAAGDVMLFTEALTHGTLPWRAAWQRRSLFYKYSPGSSSWGRDEQYDPSLWRQLSTRQLLLFEAPYVYGRTPLPRR